MKCAAHLMCHYIGNGLDYLIVGGVTDVNALCRYLGRKKCAQSVSLQPPFLRPQLTEAQLAAKILDNGIQGDLHRVRGAGRVLVKLY